MHDLEWQTIKDIFADALEQPKEVRSDFVRSKCNGNKAQYDEIISLLSSADEPCDIIESNAIDLVSKVIGETEDYAERHFGNYRIIRELGTGGMGAVFLAERDDGEFTMQVALKIVRASIADRNTIERFRAERQILAKLHHPNIASLHDGGISEKGEPFLAMEFVEGQSLIEHCESKNMSVRERLEIFVKVCSAVSYAHRNLIVHRDIKPANILVTTAGEPKLLDFGLAKIFDADGQTTQTVLRAFTPAYASPEQIKGENITTASDVYSLGVVFYELLTGVKPLSVEDKSYEEMVETIARVEPPAPSRAATSDSREEARSTFPARQSLRGDLDNIALTALNKEPDRRYRSAEAFAQDIESHLKGYPVSARPKTIAYRTSKFFRRNKVTVIAASLILITFLAGLAISYRQYRETESQKNKAEDVKGFLQKMLLSAVPEGSTESTRDFDPAMNVMLEQAAANLETEEISRQPEVKAELQHLIGAVYIRQGQIDRSIKYLRAALATAEAVPGKNELQILRIKGAIASVEFARANYTEAGLFFERSVPGIRAAFASGIIATADGLEVLNNYGLFRRSQGDSRAAESIFRESLNIAVSQGTDVKDLRNTRTYVALTLVDQGKFDEAEVIAENTISDLRENGERSINLANALTFHGIILTEVGDLAGAMTSLKEGEEIYRKLYSSDSIFIFDNLRLQAQVLYLRGDYANAKDMIEKVLQNYSRNANPKFNSYGTALTVQGSILNKLGKRAEAEAVLRRAVALRSENLPPGHFMTALTEGALGEVLLDSGKPGDAAQYLNSSYESLAASQQADNPRIAAARDRLERLNAPPQK